MHFHDFCYTLLYSNFWIRNWSHIATHVVVVVVVVIIVVVVLLLLLLLLLLFVGATLVKNAPDSIISNQIRMKFGRVVLQANMRRLIESDFQFDVTLSRWQPWRHFMQKGAATWWVYTGSVPRDAYAAAYVVLLTGRMPFWHPTNRS